MSANVQPVAFYVPSSAGEQMDVKVAHSGLRMVLVDGRRVTLAELRARLLRRPEVG